MTSKQKNSRKRQLVERYGYESRCFWCGKLLPIEQLTLDHLLPISRGGSNNLENLRLACLPCNQGRGNSLYPPGLGSRSLAGKLDL